MPQAKFLILENGVIFEGKSFGAESETTGEIVFSTGMTGYLETLTDKSYQGQIIVQTFPLIGNYGIIPADFEAGSVSARGYIVNDWCQDPSNFRSAGDLDTFLKEQGIPGLYGIDTRELTRIIRENGVMNGRLCNSPDTAMLPEIAAYRITDPVGAVSTKEIYTVNPEGKIKIALMDYGLKESIIRNLTKRGCALTVYPHDTAAEIVLAQNADGIMLSNGPGDPSQNVRSIEELKKIMQCGLPVFGICLGHQLLAIAAGARTGKLKYGHRGSNQPVKDHTTGRVYITSQNHGYSVLSDSLNAEIAEESFVNVNDKTCEGLNYHSIPAFSVQFHPEACGGPLDTEFLFDRFVQNILTNKGGNA